MNANPGLLVLAGVAFALPGLVAAYYWANWMSKGRDYPPAAAEESELQSIAKLPSFGFSLLPVVLPLLLISVSTLLPRWATRTALPTSSTS